MPSAFEGVVKSVIKEVDHSGELIPVDSLRNSTIIRPYCILRRKLHSSWFWKPHGNPRYTCLNLSIKDILEPNAPEPGISFPAPLFPTLNPQIEYKKGMG